VTYTAIYPQPQQYGASVRSVEQTPQQAPAKKNKKIKTAPIQQVAFQQPPQIIISEAREYSFTDTSGDEHTDHE